jgi:hypothetical protein
VIGNNNAPATWLEAPLPSSITQRPGAGVDGSTRVTLIWPDALIKREWLQIVVAANANTGLAAPDVFYFGNAVGEAGNQPANALVNAGDEIAARNDAHTILNPAPITNPHDYNRDSFVNAQDQIIARNNGTTIVTALRLISVPAAAPHANSSYDLLGAQPAVRSLLAAAPFDAVPNAPALTSGTNPVGIPPSRASNTFDSRTFTDRSDALEQSAHTIDDGLLDLIAAGRH